MTETERARAVALIWKHTHRDFRSDAGEPRAILVLRAGATTVVPLELLTEAEIADLLPYAERAERRAAEREGRPMNAVTLLPCGCFFAGREFHATPSCADHDDEPSAPPAEDLTPIGIQLVIPGCERREPEAAPKQGSLWFAD